MRILHLTDHYPPALGGIEGHVSALAQRQAERGDEVEVLTSTPVTADGRIAHDSGPVRVHRSRPLERIPVDLTSYDVVHTHVSVVAPYSSPIAAIAARRGVPTLVTVHSLWSRMGPVPGLAATLSGLRGAPVRWTAVSDVAAAQLRPHLSAGTEIGVLPNAADVAPRSATPVAGPGDVVRLVSTMRMARRKRPEQLLRILDSVRAGVDVPVELTIIGDGPLRARIERQATRLRRGASVRVTGRVEPAEVLDLLAAADVYVAPAVLESFGLAALEARSVGLPVVGRSDCGITEFVRHGTEGLLGASDAALVQHLRALVADPELRLRISEHNRTVPSSMTWRRSLLRHDAEYAVAGERAWRGTRTLQALSDR